MSFFKEFKDDFSQAVNELVPGEDMTDKEEELVVNTLEREVDAKAELNKMGDLFEQAEEPSAPAMLNKHNVLGKVVGDNCTIVMF